MKNLLMVCFVILGINHVMGGDAIRLNSIGFLPDAPKVATVIAECTDFQIKSLDGDIVFAGKMSGPRFQEEDTEGKLRTTMLNCLAAAEEKGIERIAFPAMGAGFYGVPLDVCAKVMVETIKGHLQGETKIKEAIICVIDSREYGPFQSRFASLG